MTVPKATPAPLSAGAPIRTATSDAAVVTRVYDVRELLVPIPNFDDAPDLRMAIRGPGTTRPVALFGSPVANRPRWNGGQGREDGPPTRAKLVNDLVRLLEETVGADTWRETGGTIGAIRELSGCLVITQTAASQREIAHLLDQLREVKSFQVTVESRFITVGDPGLREAGVKIDNPESKDPTSFPSSELTFLDEHQVDSILRSAQAPEADRPVVTSPRLTLFNGQQAYVAVTTEREYVSNFKALPTTRPTTLAATEPAAFEPEMSVVTTGVMLDLFVTVSADRKWVTFTLHPQISKLQGIDEVPWPGRPAGSNLTVQQPQIGISDLRTTVSIPDKGTLLLGGLEDPGSGFGADHPDPAAATQPTATRSTTADQPHAPRSRLFILVKPTIIFPRPPSVER
jgi:hypothetical protein